jgi:outer membrane protein OmpA-like peptidoglycan-associated protein
LFGHLFGCWALLAASPAYAGGPEGEGDSGASVSLAAGSEGPATATTSTTSTTSEPAGTDPKTLPWAYRVGIVAQTKEKSRKDIPWLKRWAPERLMAEIGLFGGLFLPNDNHDFYNPDSGYKPLWRVDGELGLRAAFFPERYIGLEVEGAGMLARARISTNDIVPMWTARGHVIAQLPWWNVAPFVLVGAGAIGVVSNPLILGRDVDPAVHWGAGVKIYLHRYVALRVEGRHVLAAKTATQNSFTSHGEFLAGLSFTLGRKKPLPAPPPDPDRDKDGFLNERDDCPDTPGVSPDGCPARDTDKDGFVDTEDACPYEAGVEPDGCPIRDQDKDGIPDTSDRCVDRPETDNGYQDEDGCPDDIPEAVREFTGIIEGIEFEFDRADIRDTSKPKLDRAIKVLTDHPDIRIEVSGHTDNEGTAQHNDELSLARAEAVKKYLVDGGVDASRIETRGAGSREPVATNETEDGRAKNRRTEFKIIKAKRAE